MEFTGRDAEQFLEHLVPADVANLKEGAGKQNHLCFVLSHTHTHPHTILSLALFLCLPLSPSSQLHYQCSLHLVVVSLMIVLLQEQEKLHFL